MRDISTILFIAAMAVSSVIYEAVYIKLQYAGIEGAALNRYLVGAVRIIWTISYAVLGFHPAVYLIGMGVLDVGAAYLRGGGKNIFLFDALYSFLIFGCFLLILISLFTLSSGRMVCDVTDAPSERAQLLLLAHLILTAVCLLSMRLKSTIISLGYDFKQDRLFLGFLSVCAVYVMVDAFFIKSPDYNTTAVLLLGAGNLLILLLITLLLYQKWQISHTKNLESDYEKISAERARERLRREQYHRSIVQDRLTGCLSRRYILGQIQRLLEEQVPFCVAFCDMDGLKEVNDTQGHEAGDLLLVRFAKQIRSRLRDRDLLARVGGDEFLVVMPGFSVEEADKRLNSIREKISDPDFPEGPISFSFGLSCGQADAESFLREADRAMYHDKMSRRREEDHQNV